MRYQNPQLLYFLFAIAIPILIHLFNFRKHKTIYFSSIRFLKEIKEDNRKKANLKNILILLSRILAISFLVLAFAKPYIPSNTIQKSSKDIFIYIDNSFSMDAENENGRLLAIAKQKANSIYKSYPTESNFWLITNDFYTQESKSISKGKLSEMISKINSSSSNKTIRQIINRSNTLSDKNNHLYIISDMQSSTLKIDELQKIDTTTTLFLIPISNNNTANISIDSCWINTPIFNGEQELEIFAEITNHSMQEISDKVIFLEVNKQQKSQQFVSLKKKESKTISFKYLANKLEIQEGAIKINDYPITFDNTLHFTFKKANKIAVSCINQNTKHTAISTLFKEDTLLFNFTNTNINAIDYNLLSQQDLVIINELDAFSSGLINTLNTFVENGGSIAIIPPKNADLDTYNLILKKLNIATLSPLKKSNQELHKINTKHPIYKNVFDGELSKINFPKVKQHYPINKQTKSNSTTLLSLDNNKSFLEAFTNKKGVIYLFSSPLAAEYNNFKKHSLFVPTLLNMATVAVQIDAIYNTIGKHSYFTTNIKVKKTDIFHLKNEKTDIIPTPKVQLGKQVFYTHNQITKNGIYTLEKSDNILDAIAYNYSPSESKTTTYTSIQINDWITSYDLKNIHLIEGNSTLLETVLNTNNKGKEFWKLALILSLLFFALETLLIKLIKS